MNYSISTQRRDYRVLLLVLALAMAGLMFLMAVQANRSHAVQKHGASYILVRKCLDDNNADQVWKNPVTGRWAEICKMADGRFGIRISEKIHGMFEEVTGWIFEEEYELWHVEEYMIRRGYMMMK